MGKGKGAMIWDSVVDATVIEIGGDDQSVMVELAGGVIVQLDGVPVETLREIGSTLMYQSVRVAISIHYPDPEPAPF
jgi:hypothetical protein